MQSNLEELLKARGIIKPFAFLIKAGIPAFTATQMVNGTLKAIKLEYMELLCRLLYCTPNDMFFWVPGNAVLPETHPLTKLKSSIELHQLSEAIKTLPLDELKRLVANNGL